jgi:hypothetical protein
MVRLVPPPDVDVRFPGTGTYGMLPSQFEYVRVMIAFGLTSAAPGPGLADAPELPPT